MEALIVSTKNNEWIPTYRSINLLLSYGVKVLWSKEAIQEALFKEAPGAFIIPLDDIIYDNINERNLQSYKPITQKKMLELFKNENINVEKIVITKQINVVNLFSTRIALYQDSGCYNHALVLSSAGFHVDWVTGMEISSGILNSYDVLMSGGGGRAKKANINRENLLLASMGVDGAKKISEFVKTGGAYFGCCGGSYIGSVIRERFMNWWHPAKNNMTMMNVEDFYFNENSDSGFKSPGQGVFMAKNTAPENPIMFGVPEFFECVHWNGPVWNLIEAAVDDASSPISIVELKNVTPETFTPSEFFKTSESQNKENIKKTGFYKACKKGKTAIAQGFYGSGLVVLSGSHPERITEFDLDLDKNKLWDSARILCNASFWAPSISSREKKKSVKKYNNFIIPFQSYNEEDIEKLKRIKKNSDILTKNIPKEKDGWLDQKNYSLAFGLTPIKMYSITLGIIPILCEKIITGFKKTDDLVKKSRKMIYEIKREIANIKKTPDQTSDHDQIVLNLLLENGLGILFRYFSLLGKQKEPLWDQGDKQVFHGIYDNIRIANEHLDNAINRYNYLSTNLTSATNELVNNPYTNTGAARTRLENALIQIWVNEAELSRFITLWELCSN